MPDAVDPAEDLEALADEVFGGRNGLGRVVGIVALGHHDLVARGHPGVVRRIVQTDGKTVSILCTI